MKEPLHTSTDARGVCRLTLNRPDRANALDAELVQQLLNAFAHVRADTAIRLVILSGQGELFSSGADLQWMQKMAKADFSVNQTDAFELALLFEELPN